MCLKSKCDLAEWFCSGLLTGFNPGSWAGVHLKAQLGRPTSKLTHMATGRIQLLSSFWFEDLVPQWLLARVLPQVTSAHTSP